MIPQRSRGRATAAAGASLVVVLALVDLVVDESAVLIPLLVLGPLMAAISAEVRATAAVGAMAIVLAAALGAADEGIFDPQHVVQVMVVIAGSFFAVAAAVARSRFEAAERAAAAALAGEREARIQANMIARASELLATTLDPEERLAQVVALAVPELADVGTVDLLEPDGSLRGAASDAAEPGVAQSVLDGRRRWPIDPASAHPVAVAARTGRPQLISTMSPEHLEETAQSPGHLELMRGLGYSSGIAVPLVARGRTLGVIAFVRRAGREPYDQDDLRLAIELARRSATAVDNARLFAELRRTERQLEAVLGNLAEAVTVQAPDHSLLYVNYAAAHLLECRSPEEVLSTPMQEILARFIPLDEDGGPFDYSRLPGRHALAGETPEPVLMRNISLATGDERWMLVKSTPVRDVDGDVAMAVNIIEDVTDARRTEYHQRFLAGASKLLSASLDVDATLERAAAALVPEIADWCWVDVPDERGRLVRRAVAVDPDRADEVAALRDAIGSGPAGTEAARVLDDGRPRLHARVDEELLQGWASGAALDTLRRAGLRSVLTVPLVAGTRVVGTMTMGTDRSGRALGELELALAEELGIRAGVATENARLHATRTHIATTLQRSLLPPRLPAVPGMTISARFRAAGEATEVGGDFYDLFPVSERLDGDHGRRHRQGAGGRGDHLAGPLHDAHRRGLRAQPRRRPRAPQRDARRRPRPPPALHRGVRAHHRPPRRPRRRHGGGRRTPAAVRSARRARRARRGGRSAAGGLRGRRLDGDRGRPRARREPCSLHRRGHGRQQRGGALRRGAPGGGARRRRRPRPRRHRLARRRGAARLRAGSAARRRRAARPAGDGRARGDRRVPSAGCENIAARRLT